MSDDTIEDLEPLEEELQEEGKAAPAPRIVADRGIIASFTKNPLPVLILDDQLLITFANDSCTRLFAGFYRLVGARLPDVFGRSLGVATLKDLVNAVRSPDRGFSWKGTIRSKDRESGTVLTKSYIFPVHATTPSDQTPPAYVALFDDVTEENKSLLRSVYLSLLEASKLKDNDTGSHINRVNFYSERLATELFDKPGYEEIDRDFIDDIAFLASMHDVGKIGTPDDILNKEGKLSDWEWTIMKEHTKNGAYLLSTYPNPMAREIALYHHERWDGSGYPYNLEKTMIPLAARIVSVVDVYDALRMKRSYKESCDHATAVEKVKEWSGSHFDPALIEVFNRISDCFDDIFRKNAD